MNTSVKAFKVMLLLLSTFAPLLIAFSQQPTSQRDASSEQAQSVKKVFLGCINQRSTDCQGDGYGCLVIFPAQQWSSMRQSISEQTLTLAGDAEVRDGDSPYLYYEFKSSPSKEVSVIPLDKDIPLDQAIAESLGFKSVILLKGKYRVNSKIGKFGGVVIRVRVTK
jgi:hypothetical protein